MTDKDIVTVLCIFLMRWDLNIMEILNY